jgi:beta-lactamase family protein
MNQSKAGRATWLLLAAIAARPDRVLAFCHELDMVQNRVFRVAAGPAPAMTIEWLGHSTFEMVSSKGTRVLTDPHGAFDLPRPTLPQHIVTTSHRHGPHSSVHMAPGTPVILHGLTPSGDDWQKISTTIRDVSVYVVPAYHDKSRGMQRGKNAIFVFRIDDICIAHLGDLGHVLGPDQLKMIGKIDSSRSHRRRILHCNSERGARGDKTGKSKNRHPETFLVGTGRTRIYPGSNAGKNDKKPGAENLQTGAATTDRDDRTALGRR